MTKAEPTSPCIGRCELIHGNDEAFCVGCLRTSGEITDWSRLTLDYRIERTRELIAQREERNRLC